MINVLIVDDEPLVRIGIKSSIDWEGNGLNLVAEAANGAQALEAIKQTHPDIVITDIKMPVMDGIQLIKEIKLNYSGIFSVVLSCHDDFEYVKEAMKYGAVDYFIKTDLDPDGILEILKGLKDKIDKNRESNLNKTWDKQIAGEYLTFIKDSFVKDLISGLLPSEREINEKIKICNLDCLEEKYILMLVEIDNFSEVKKKYVEKDEKLLQFSIKNMLEELLGKSPNINIFIIDSREYIICQSLEPSEMGKKTEDKIVEKAAKVNRIIKDYLNIGVSVGISKLHRTVIEIKDAYSECRKALEYKFLKGKGSIINYNDIRLLKEQCKAEIIDDALRNKMKFGVKALDLQVCSEILMVLKNYLLKSNCIIKGNLIKKEYLKIIELFKAFLIEEGLDVNNDLDPYRQILEAEDVFEVHTILEEYFALSINKVHEDKEDSGRPYIEKALEYINNHYDSDISLNFLAEKVGLNPSYLSRSFSRETGENFIDYLTKVRIEKSKQLLLKGIKAVEVAEKVGYPNYTYFSKLFKKVVGVNPSEFVDENR